MNDHEATFVEQLGQHLSARGMQRMAGRAWSWLLICDPPEQTAEQLAEALHASRGAISGAMRVLTSAGFVHRGRRRGDRREFFSAPPGAIRRLVANGGTVMAQGREIADEGLALLADRPPEDRARLLEFRDLYAYYEREWPILVARYRADRTEANGGVVPGADRAQPPPGSAVGGPSIPPSRTNQAAGAPERIQRA